MLPAHIGGGGGAQQAPGASSIPRRRRPSRPSKRKSNKATPPSHDGGPAHGRPRATSHESTPEEVGPGLALARVRNQQQSAQAASGSICKLQADDERPEARGVHERENVDSAGDQDADEAQKPLIGIQRREQKQKQDIARQSQRHKSEAPPPPPQLSGKSMPSSTTTSENSQQATPADRRLSQCSQSSTQLVAGSLSSSGLGGPNSTSHTRAFARNASQSSSSVCFGLDLQQQSKPARRAGPWSWRNFLVSKLTGAGCGYSPAADEFDLEAAAGSENCPLAGRHRTISQSMLELDGQSQPGDTFRVSWRELTFAYEASWLTRTGNKLGRLAGLVAKEQPAGDCAPPAPTNVILRNLSGGFESNQLVAVIGPSGSGKTTLLQFLAGNNSSHQARIRIRGLGEPKVAYIGQHDSLLPGLSARETLLYASRLQNNLPDFDHHEHVKPILAELGLLECADRNVCKLSGGQAKRVAIAQELLYPTNILILDEVTSGLDASTSYSIVKLLKYLVSDRNYPMSIVMSIHQPSARLFAVFDQVYVMSEGCCLYEGSCRLQEINSRLAQFHLECPRYHNIADYLIELACSSGDELIDTTSGGADGEPPPAQPHAAAYSHGPSSSGRIKELMSDHQRRRHLLQDKLEREQQAGSLYQAIERARSRRPRPFLAHFRLHFQRSLLRIRRSYILTYLQLVTYIVLGLLISTFYGPDIGRMSGCPRLPSSLMSFVLSSASERPANCTDAEQADDMTLEMRRIQENMNFLLVTVMTATFAALEITVITFPLEAKSIKREWRNGWYRVSSYFMGRTLADLPFQLAFVVVFSLLVYVLTGQIGLASWRFGAFVATIVMTALVAQAFGFMFGALFMDNLPAAVFTAPLAIFPALLFSGFFSRVSQIPAFYRPMTYLSHFRYAFDALLVTLYGHNRCNCDQEHLTSYHASLRNQTSSMRDMFSYLFGGAGGPADCAPLEATTATAAGQGQVSREDLAAIQASNQSVAAQLVQTLAGVGLATPPPAAHESGALGLAEAQAKHASFMKPLEDALIESVFQQANASSLSSSLLDDPSNGSDESTSLMDRMANKFAHSLTTMLNRQANYGHPMPTECGRFNSYLLTEFGLQDGDLIRGLLMLLLVVLVTRLLCNCILNFTIASRAD